LFCLALSCLVVALSCGCLVVVLSCCCLALSRAVLSCQVLSCDLSCLVLWLSCLVLWLSCLVVFESDSTMITQLLPNYFPKRVIKSEAEMLFCFIICVSVPNCVILVLSLHYHSQSRLVLWLSFVVLSSPVVVVSCLVLWWFVLV
jgi:hypothetical protein